MILQRQLLKHFSHYLDGHPDQEPVIPAGQVVIGDLLAEWQDVFRVSSFDRLGLEVRDLRNVREQLHQHIQKAFALWQQDTTPIELAAQEEALSLGREIIEAFFSHISETLLPYGSGRRMLQSHLELIPPPNSRLVSNMIRILTDRGISDPLESIEKIGEYLRSTHMLRVPFIRLMAMLFAAMARKAPSRKEPPNRGTSIDVTAIASILPYCDAMFLDREMVGYLNEKPLRDELAHFETQVFSAKSRAAGFLGYLDEIEARAGKGHVALIERSYPHGWLDPFMDVVTQGN